MTLGLAVVGLIFGILHCYYVNEDENGGSTGKAKGAGDYGERKSPVKACFASVLVFSPFAQIIDESAVQKEKKGQINFVSIDLFVKSKRSVDCTGLEQIQKG